MAYNVPAVYRIKVTLRYSSPEIWRRLDVPDSTPLATLHDILQMTMGWDNCHLHEFNIERRKYGDPEAIDEEGVSDENLVKLRDLPWNLGATLQYWYDFGDDWMHDLLLEGILLRDPDVIYPRCLEGARKAPPESIGGIPGFEHYRRIIGDLKHGDREETLKMYGPFDAKEFSADDVNARLKKKYHRATKKK